LYQQRIPRTIAVVFMDLDHFKFVNDSLGHRTGDKLLKGMADRLRTLLREGDTVARLGGDEFVLMLNDQSSAEVIFRAMQRVAARLAEPIMIEGKELHVTCSAGIAIYPQDGGDVDTLLKNADAAMYRAKEQGRNNVQFYTSEMNQRVSERLSLENALRGALERKEFILHYQQRVDLRTGAIIGAEALLRWMRPEWGLVLPAQFIPLAEETGLIVPIGRWVLQTACAQNIAWQKQGLPAVSMAVSLSPRQFSEAGLLRDIDTALADSGLAPELLQLEITESTVMLNIGRAVEVLDAIQSRGVRLAIDDFGMSYSSMSLMKRFPIDTIKIDRSFMQGLPQGTQDKGMAASIIGLGRALGLTVVAEGVETEDQETFVREHACDELQGSLFSKAVSPVAVAALLQSQLAPPSPPLQPLAPGVVSG
jgi:diguanylate cyclase (GGDEF)-like protein